MPVARSIVGVTASIALVAALAPAAVAAPPHEHGRTFDRVATYPVFQNLPKGVDPASQTVAEISAASEDGRTLIYTDAPGKRIGFLDISDPHHPKGAGSLDLTTLGDTEDEPTSVAVRGEYVLVVVNTSESYTKPSGRLDVVRIKDRTRVRSIDLGGQPDSIAIGKDGKFGAIAIENERDEDATPAGGKKGDLPQMPAGFVQRLAFPSDDPASWTATRVNLVDGAGTPVPALAKAGLDTPTDPEPEYVSINERGLAAVTLQENNGVVLIDLASASVRGAFSAGTATVSGVDAKKDGRFEAKDTISGPREPDSIAWVDATHVATADEGDWKGGTRTWTIFDTTTGKVTWSSGNELEQIATRLGHHNEDRAAKKGVEPEGLAFARYHGRTFAFVGMERAGLVAVYDMKNPLKPQFVQALPTTIGPEGILPITGPKGRQLLAVSSEEDDAEAGVRATVTLFELGGGNRDGIPTIVSENDAAGAPIGWGALSGLTATGRTTLAAVSDSAYANGRIYTIETPRGKKAPARITDVMDVRDAKGPAKLDLEGISARRDGGYWLAHEGKKGGENALVRVDATGLVQQTVALPAEVTKHVGKWGLEGVSVIGSGDDESVFFALQRPLWKDPEAKTLEPAEGNVARIGRYDVATGQFSWYAYPLEKTSTKGDWIGLSEVTAVDGGRRLLVVERDKLNGPAAKVKRVYAVDLGDPHGTRPKGMPTLKKTLVKDLLPTLKASNGWVQEKVEGFTVTPDGRAWMVTDNDALDDNSGETVFAGLGRLRH